MWASLILLFPGHGAEIKKKNPAAARSEGLREGLEAKYCECRWLDAFANLEGCLKLKDKSGSEHVTNHLVQNQTRQVWGGQEAGRLRNHR